MTHSHFDSQAASGNVTDTCLLAARNGAAGHQLRGWVSPTQSHFCADPLLDIMSSRAPTHRQRLHACTRDEGARSRRQASPLAAGGGPEKRTSSDSTVHWNRYDMPEGIITPPPCPTSAIKAEFKP